MNLHKLRAVTEELRHRPELQQAKCAMQGYSPGVSRASRFDLLELSCRHSTLDAGFDRR